jgi:hypothetical protein
MNSGWPNRSTLGHWEVEMEVKIDPVSEFLLESDLILRQELI